MINNKYFKSKQIRFVSYLITINIFVFYLTCQTLNWWSNRALYAYFTPSQRFVFVITDRVVEWEVVSMQAADQQVDTTMPSTLRVSEQQLHAARAKLVKTLQRALTVYHDQHTPAAIHAYLAWLETSPRMISHINNYHDKLAWFDRKSDEQGKLYDALREAVGFYNIESQENALTMAMVPEAEKALRSHPNDPERCTIMQHYPSQSAKVQAEQIAFLTDCAKFSIHSPCEACVLGGDG